MADKENVYGIKYEVDIEELKTSTQEASRQIKLANAEFKKSSSSMDNWATSTDGVSAKIKQLETILDAQKSKLAQLKNEYNGNIDTLKKYDTQIAELKAKKEQAIEQYGEESEEVKNLDKQITKLTREQEATKVSSENLNVSILNQEATVNKTARQVEKYNTKLSDLQTEQNASSSAMDKLKTSINKQESELQGLKEEYANVVLEQGKSSDEAKNLATKITELNSKLSKSKSELSEVEGEADSLTSTLKSTRDGADEAEGGFTIMKGALADLVASGVEFAIGKIGDLVGQLFELSDATQEYRTMSAKLEGSAETFGYSADFAKEKYKELYGYLKDDQMATNAITNLMGLGASTDTVSDIVNSAIGVWSAYGDSIPIEGLTESINESAQVAKVTGSLADALNWAGISEDEFNKKLATTNGTKERAQLIADTLNAKYGESKTTYDQLTGSMTEANRAEAELKETQAELGATMEPVNTAITGLKTKALDIVSPAVEFFAGKIQELTTYLSENPTAMKAVETTAIALATAFGVLAVALGISAIISGVTKAIGLLNATLWANPITWIVALIAGAVAALVYLWNTSDGFRNTVTTIWETIKTTVGGVIEFILGKFSEWGTNLITFVTSDIPNFITSAISFFAQLPGRIGAFLLNVISSMASWVANMASKAVQAGSTFLSNIVNFFTQLPGKIASFLTSAISRVISFAGQLASKGLEAGRNLLNNVVNGVKGLPSKMLSIGKDVVKGLWNGINDMIDWVIGKVKGFGSSVMNGIKSALGINSPSKITYYFGEMVDMGLGNAIADGTRKVVQKARTMSRKVLTAMKDNLKEKVSVGYELVDDLKARTRGAIGRIALPDAGGNLAYAGGYQSVNNINFYQNNYSPKNIDSLETYRNTRKQLKQLARWKGKQ